MTSASVTFAPLENRWEGAGSGLWALVCQPCCVCLACHRQSFFFISLFIQSLLLQWKLHLPFIKALYLPYRLFCRCLKDRWRSQKEGGEEAMAREAKLGGSAAIRQRFLIYHVHIIFSSAKKKREKKVNLSYPAGVVCAWKMMEMSTRVNPLVLAGHDAGRGRSLPFPQLQTTYLWALQRRLPQLLPLAQTRAHTHRWENFTAFCLKRQLNQLFQLFQLFQLPFNSSFVFFSLCTSCPCLETKPAARNVKRPGYWGLEHNQELGVAMIMLMCILSYLKHLTLHLHYVKITVETLSSRAWSDCVITHAHIQ